MNLIKHKSQELNFHIDGLIGARHISGWLLDKSDPKRSFTVALCLNGNIICEVVSNRPISDTCKTGRFIFYVPDSVLKDGDYDFDIKLMDEGINLETVHCHIGQTTSKILEQYPFLAEKEHELRPSGRNRRDLRMPLPNQLPPGEALTADEMLRSGLLEDAYRLYKEQASANPDVAANHLGIMRALAALGREEEALAYYNGLPTQLHSNAWIREEWRRLQTLTQNKGLKTLAFYLPQFHPIPENDIWWGKGFTEWNNVSRASALFDGHVQPRYPGELGYYDLRLPEVANAQFKMAREYGIDGFCYYYYWFNGKKLLEKPLTDLVTGKTGPFPFCICWANENWTRRWDGGENEVLIDQTHTLESDAEFIRDIAPYLAHKDYIRHKGRPLLLVYRVYKMADAAATARLWREYCRNNGIGEIYLAMMQVGGRFDDPLQFGFDAAVEFPPQCNTGRYPWQHFYKLIDQTDAPACAFDYERFSTGHRLQGPVSYPIFRGTTLAWDNSARRKLDGLILHNYHAPMHQKWLWEVSGRMVREHGEGIVFINAWNEWGEGATLEPDNYWGYANLISVAKVKDSAAYSGFAAFWQEGLPISGRRMPFPREHIAIICASDQASLQMALYMARELKLQKEHPISIIFDNCDIQSIEPYKRLGPVYNLGEAGQLDLLPKTIRDLSSKGCDKIIAIGGSSGRLASSFRQAGFNIVAIPLADTGAGLSQLVTSASTVVCDSEANAIKLGASFWPDLMRIVISQPPITPNPHLEQKELCRKQLTKALGISPNYLIIAASGQQPSIALFIRIMDALKKMLPDIHFMGLWLATSQEEADKLTQLLKSQNLAQLLRIVDGSSDILQTLAGADLYVAYDASDTKIIDSLATGLPTVCYKNNANIDSPLIEASCLSVAENEKELLYAISNIAQSIHSNQINPRDISIQAQKAFSWCTYTNDLLSLFSDTKPDIPHRLFSEVRKSCPLHKVSVILYNYNCGRYLELRLRSIFDQTAAISEIIVIDDASTDISLKILARYEQDAPVPINFIYNSAHSGNRGEQLQRGLKFASGDLIWFVDASDYSEKILVESLLPFFDDQKVSMAFCASNFVDHFGRQAPKKDNPHPAVNWNFVAKGKDLVQNEWLKRRYLPAPSSFIFRKEAAPNALENLYKFPNQHEFHLLLNLAQAGKIAFCGRPLNYARTRPKDKRQRIADFSENLLSLQELATKENLSDCFSLFTWLEEEYHSCATQENSAWLANNPEYAAIYAKLKRTLNPLADMAKGPAKHKAALLVDKKALAANISDLGDYLKRKYELIIIDIEEQSARVPEDSDEIWCLGLPAANVAARAAPNKNVYIVCDASFSRKNGKNVISANDLPGLAQLFKRAEAIYSLTDPIPGIAASLLACAKRICHKLDWQNSLFLSRNIDKARSLQDAEWQSYDLWLPMILKKALFA